VLDLKNRQHPLNLPSPFTVVVIAPLRDDWASAAELIRRIDQTVSQNLAALQVLLVDDGSLLPSNAEDFSGPHSAVTKVSILRLRRNLGHQRAIAIGLSYVQQNIPCDAVLVMDADGEDTAEGVAQLSKAFADLNGSKAVFAERTRRSESLSFRVFYKVYKFLHFCLTGNRVRVGNFSILPASHLNPLIVMSELWNHYAAAVFRSSLPLTMIPIPRGTRIAGASRMNFVALVTHGLSAISVFADVVGVRLLILCLLGSFLAMICILSVVAVKFFTHSAIPGWATYASGTLVIILIQILTIATSFTFFMLSNRANLGFVPIRDYSFFAESTTVLYPAAPREQAGQ
jgi:glycosyltransferase involved in cell wall biosynthesis